VRDAHGQDRPLALAGRSRRAAARSALGRLSWPVRLAVLAAFLVVVGVLIWESVRS
jgi:hypothetical protein